MWATVAGPAKRPGIVITDGSVQADEQMYWYAAQTLAKDGYVVLTFDPQGQGQSDTFGQSPDQDEGVPAQTDGRPFYDGTEDAIDFLLSTPAHPYEPVPSCSSGTSHAAKQNARVAAGLDAAYNPFWQLLEPDEIGLAGHSYGAAGVSYIAQWDPRVKAVVALDNLGGPGPDAGSVPGSAQPLRRSASRAARRTPPTAPSVPITKPALGISADYGLPPTPNTSLPDPRAKEHESLAYTKAGVDSGEIIIRGGSHLDFSFIPNQAFGASLRGPGHHRLVHDRVVRQVPQARALGRRAAADRALARRPGRGRRRPQPRRQRVLLLLLLAAGHPPGQRRRVRLRGPARRLPRDGRRRRLPGRLLLRLDRHHSGCGQRARRGAGAGQQPDALHRRQGDHHPTAAGETPADHEREGLRRPPPRPARRGRRLRSVRIAGLPGTGTRIACA